MAGRSNKKQSRRGAMGVRGGKPSPASSRGIISRFFYAIGLIAAWAAVLGLGLCFYYAYDLPDLADIKLAPRQATLRVLDREGSPLAIYGDVYGDWLEFEEFPVPLIQAVIATEDRRFFDHSGVDIRGLTRAAVQNLRHGRVVQGGSTLTQQLAKNLFLSSDRTMKRKVQELLLSFWLEVKFNKQELLTIYLNRIYFGSRAYGIDAAARTYFGHSARKLNLAEAAMLAGIVKGPAYYSPLRDLERSYNRMAEVLDNMVEAGLLSATEAAVAKKSDLTIRSQRGGGADVRYFTDWVIDQLGDIIGVTRDALIVKTTLDPRAQGMAEASLRDRMDQEAVGLNAGQAALISMHMDGAVRAMVGGRSYAESQFNRSVQARRQPGSAFKLFVYLAALEAGLGPETQMRDSPVIFEGWRPKNYGGTYRGMVSLRDAFVYSVNTVAVKLSERVDRQRVIDFAKNMGITTDVVSEPSVALGASDVRLIDLTAAYGIVANGGLDVQPYGIVEVRTASGDVIWRHQPRSPRRVITTQSADVMDDILRDVVTRGTGRAARLSVPVAGKTGTSQSFRDALFIGYVEDTVSAVWVGNDDSSPMKQVTGGGLPARIWRDYTQQLLTGRAVHGGPTTPPVIPRDKPPTPSHHAGQENGGFWQKIFPKR